MMARSERREVFGSSRRKLVHVAAATAAAAAGIYPRSAPASTSQRQRNHAAREAALDHNPAAVTPEPMSRLSEDPLMPDSSDFVAVFRIQRSFRIEHAGHVKRQLRDGGAHHARLIAWK